MATKIPDICPGCGSPLSASSAGPSMACPHCGWKPVASENGPTGFTGYFRALFRIHTHPVRFFQDLPITGGLAGPLAFALVTHWLGAALEYLWRISFIGYLGDLSNDFFKIAGDVVDVDNAGRGALLLQARERFIHWVWGTGSIVLDPFVTLASILFTSLLVFIGARILVNPFQDDSAPPRKITYESAVRIVCFGMGPAILASIPLVGTFISPLIVMIVTIIGVREVYRIGTFRAIIVGLFPKILFLAIILVGFLWIAIILVKIFASAL